MFKPRVLCCLLFLSCFVGANESDVCPGDTPAEIGDSFWVAWSDYYALSNINQGDAPYRTDLVGTRTEQEVLTTFNACLSKLDKIKTVAADDDLDALKWIARNEAARLNNPILALNFSTVYSWLDLYRVAVSSQPWHTEEGQSRYPEHVDLLPDFINSQTEILRHAAEHKQVQSCAATQHHLSAIQHSLAQDRFYFTVMAPFNTPEEKHINAADRAVKALKAYADTLENVYLPACRDEISVYAWPDGKKAYQEALRYYTSTDLTAEQIHQIGLKQVSQLMAEVDRIRLQPSFYKKYPSESPRHLFQLLRDDPELGFQSQEDMLQQSASWGKLIRDGKRGGFAVPDDFPELLTSAVPEAIAANSAEAMYQTGSDGTAGTMYINTAHPEKSRRYLLPAVVLHEGFPGHHYQMFAKLRNQDLIHVRQKYYFHAMGEGWALYTESLTAKLLPEVSHALPHPDLLSLGALSYDLLRAARLVVDTGLHAKAWTRERAVDFIVSNTAVPEVAAKNAVERFISLPAQATSYKIGQLAILDARASVEAVLGSHFNEARFHEAVLHRTSLPLTVFARSMQAWAMAELTKQHATPQSVQ